MLDCYNIIKYEQKHNPLSSICCIRSRSASPQQSKAYSKFATFWHTNTLHSLYVQQVSNRSQ